MDFDGVLPSTFRVSDYRGGLTLGVGQRERTVTMLARAHVSCLCLAFLITLWSPRNRGASGA